MVGIVSREFRFDGDPAVVPEARSGQSFGDEGPRGFTRAFLEQPINGVRHNSIVGLTHEIFEPRLTLCRVGFKPLRMLLGVLL